MGRTSLRTQGFTESLIRKMTRIANQYGAINLAQGFPDFSPPDELLRAASELMKSGPHQYAVTWGAPGFRAALADKQSRFMSLDLDPNRNIVVTCGSTEAMMASLLAVCDPGDKVVVFSPFYENYGADALLCGAETLYVPLNPPDFTFREAELRAAFEQKPKALILCNPSNPSGKVFSEDELLTIAGLAQEFDTLVICDEVYEHIVYPPNRHRYFASLPGMFERTLSCSSLSKTYSITGWRLGYVIGPPDIIDAVKKVHDFLTVGAAAPLQEAAIVGLGFPDAYYEELQRSYEKKRELFLGYLDEAALPYVPPQGAYYVLCDISEFIRDPESGNYLCDDLEFCEWLIKCVGLAAVPGSSFFRGKVVNYIRFHFAKKEETLIEAGRRLLTLRDKWKNRGGESLPPAKPPNRKRQSL